ncbi:Fc.00g095000.m01.CDS01 [Cosmosporella sp. VM-42]
MAWTQPDKGDQFGQHFEEAASNKSEMGTEAAVASGGMEGSLSHIDKQTERKLRLKIDLYIVPTVSILWLF